MRAASDRRGFTLVELLVVIAIIGVLVALLLPAVQMAREAARHLDCTNRLKQISLALHSYHATNGAYPAGNYVLTAGICHGGEVAGKDYPSEDGANWMISILPQLEQSNLYAKYNFAAFNESYENAAVRQTHVAAYLCPSDVRQQELTTPAVGPASAYALDLKYMPGSYRGVSGRSNGVDFLDGSYLGTYNKTFRGPLHAVGVSGFGYETSAHIRDGASNTLLVGEYATQTQPSFRTLWAYSYMHYSLSAVTPQARTLLADYDACVAIAGAGGSTPCRRGWGSFHSGVINFALCDGSVRQFSTSCDVEMLAGMASIAGGETGNVE